MKKTLFIALVAILAVGGASWLLLRATGQQPSGAPAKVALKDLGYRALLTRAIACEEDRSLPDCTLTLELLALKSQPQQAKQGEKFWMRQMFRLGEWYTWAGTHAFQPGGETAPEIGKAVELYDWVLDQKPFFGDQALYGKARLYDSQWNEAWASAHRDEARALYEKIVRVYPDSPYAAEATSALERL